jgi:hypothetical protein
MCTRPVEYGTSLCDWFTGLLLQKKKYQVFARPVVSYIQQFNSNKAASNRTDLNEESLSFLRSKIGTFLTRVTPMYTEGDDGDSVITVYVKSVCYVSTLAAAGKKAVGLWLVVSEASDQLYAVDLSYGICHIPEEELQAAQHGAPELVDVGCGLFWVPDEVKPSVDFSSFSSTEHAASLAQAAAEKKEQDRLAKEKQDEIDRLAYEKLRERLDQEKNNLIVTSKRRKVA